MRTKTHKLANMALFGAAALIACVLGATPVNAVVVFSDDFEGGAASEWVTGSTDSSVAVFTQFLGRYGNVGDTLQLTGLASHTTVTVHFDLYLLDSWDGDGEPGGGGPDEFLVIEGASNTVFSDRFCNLPTFVSPCSFPVLSGPPDVGPTQLGFGGRRVDPDSIYRDLVGGISFAHTAATLDLTFVASGLQALADESWGIDNLEVSISGVVSDAPEPVTLALLGVGLAAMGFRRRHAA